MRNGARPLKFRGGVSLIFSDGSTLGFHEPLETALGPEPWRVVLEQTGLAWKVFRPFERQYRGQVIMSGGHAGRHTWSYRKLARRTKPKSGIRGTLQRIAAEVPESGTGITISASTGCSTASRLPNFFLSSWTFSPNKRLVCLAK